MFNQWTSVFSNKPVLQPHYTQLLWLFLTLPFVSSIFCCSVWMQLSLLLKWRYLWYLTWFTYFSESFCAILLVQYPCLCCSKVHSACHPVHADLCYTGTTGVDIWNHVNHTLKKCKKMTLDVLQSYVQYTQNQEEFGQWLYVCWSVCCWESRLLFLLK